MEDSNMSKEKIIYVLNYMLEYLKEHGYKKNFYTLACYDLFKSHVTTAEESANVIVMIGCRECIIGCRENESEQNEEFYTKLIHNLIKEIST